MNRKLKKLEISDIAILVAISVLFLTVFLLCCFFFCWNPVSYAVTPSWTSLVASLLRSSRRIPL